MTESLRPISATPRVLVETLTALNADALALFWPAFAARAGARLDRRAIARLVAFTTRTIACLQDGTIQPALIPIAGRVDPERSDDSNTTPRDNASDVGTAHIRQHIVHLVYAPVRAPVHTWIYRARRAWQFSVRNDLVSGRSWHGGASVV